VPSSGNVGLAIGVQTGIVRVGNGTISMVAVAVGDPIGRGVEAMLDVRDGIRVGDGPSVSLGMKIGSGVSSNGMGVHVS
jgi:hypothetical protein